MEGNIVVDGVLASCYGNFHHDVAHITMFPIQLFPEMTQWMFGEEDESAIFFNIMNNIGTWLVPSQHSF